MLTANEIDINNENSIMFTPAGELYLGITSGNKQQKLSSKAGRCIAVKPAELLTAGLVAFVSVVKEMIKLNGWCYAAVHNRWQLSMGQSWAELLSHKSQFW